MIIQEDRRGIRFDLHGAPEAPQAGEFVELEYISRPGKLALELEPRRVTPLGLGGVPEPIKPTWD